MKNMKYSILLATLLAVSTSNASIKEKVTNFSSDAYNNVKTHKLTYGLSGAGLALSSIVAYDIIKNGEESRTLKALKATGLFASEQGKKVLKQIKNNPWIATPILVTSGIGTFVLCDLFARKESKNSLVRKAKNKIAEKLKKKKLLLNK